MTRLKEEGKTHKEIGEIVGMTKAAVDALIWRMNNKPKKAGEPIAEFEVKVKDEVKLVEPVTDDLPFDDIEVPYDPLIESISTEPMITIQIPLSMIQIVELAIANEGRRRSFASYEEAIRLLEISKELKEAHYERT